MYHPERVIGTTAHQSVALDTHRDAVTHCPICDRELCSPLELDSDLLRSYHDVLRRHRRVHYNWSDRSDPTYLTTGNNSQLSS